MALSTADRLEILDLAARYNFAIDEADGEAWAATFTPGGVFDAGRGDVTGTAALVAFVHDFQEHMAGTEHWTNNHVIDGDGGQATHRCYLNLIRGESGESLVRAKYNDTLVKAGGEWKFARRVVR